MLILVSSPPSPSECQQASNSGQTYKSSQAQQAHTHTTKPLRLLRASDSPAAGLSECFFWVSIVTSSMISVSET